jgi:hypothetical protein
MGDAVEAAVIRKQNILAKKNEKARLHAKKMMDLDVAVQTKLANTNSELNGEIAAFGNSKRALKTYLQEQYKSRTLLRDGVYTIPVGSEYRSKKKPYRLRMIPLPTESKRNGNDTQITYLKSLLYVMMAEDAQRALEPAAQPQDAKLVRNLPVISETFLNLKSTHLKKLQQDTVAALAQPKDNPWHTMTKFYGTGDFSASLSSSTMRTKGGMYSLVGRRQQNQSTRMKTEHSSSIIATKQPWRMVP